MLKHHLKLNYPRVECSSTPSYTSNQLKTINRTTRLTKKKMTKPIYNSLLLTAYLLCLEIIDTNSRTSTLWKLSPDESKIIEASPFHQIISMPNSGNGPQFVTDDDPIFNIITSTVHFGQSWIKQGVEYYCTHCQNSHAKITQEKYVVSVCRNRII